MIVRSLPSKFSRLRRNLISSIKPLAETTAFPFQFRQASQSAIKVIFSGIQPTGVPHLGNYLGALQQWVELQKEPSSSTRLFYCVVDLHAITLSQDPQQLQKWRRETLAALLAVGLDPDRCNIFFQSSVPAHCELMWILSCTASVGYLSRMTQWKSKLLLPEQSSVQDAAAKAKLKLGLFSYPVLQAADILLYGTTHVPVGEDQIQHLEFARECAGNFNAVYGHVLTQPKTILSPAKRIMSLKQPMLKMSKSHADPRSRILISDSQEDIAMKIRLAMTDSISGVSYDPVSRPGVSNLLSIMSHLDEEERSCEELAEACKGLTLRQFKDKASEAIDKGVSEIRDRYIRLMQSSGATALDAIARQGAATANREAGATMVDVRRAMGLH
ncbi:MAG: hypothetical protein Q9195_001572 [Heterodermia aff. obscurata]